MAFITVEATIHRSIERVWECWTSPKHIVKWNNASDDWHTPRAENDLRVGGKFLCRMEAKDGSVGFDFVGTYDAIEKHELIIYTIADGRKVTVHFAQKGSSTRISETFDTENENPIELQRSGWQSILNSFKKYVESN